MLSLLENDLIGGLVIDWRGRVLFENEGGRDVIDKIKDFMM